MPLTRNEFLCSLSMVVVMTNDVDGGDDVDTHEHHLLGIEASN